MACVYPTAVIYAADARDDIQVPAMSSKAVTRYRTYVLETNDTMARESLNRVSGNIDLGFSAPENSFKSVDQEGVGPFAKEKAETKKQSESVY